MADNFDRIIHDTDAYKTIKFLIDYPIIMDLIPMEPRIVCRYIADLPNIIPNDQVLNDYGHTKLHYFAALGIASTKKHNITREECEIKDKSGAVPFWYAVYNGKLTTALDLLTINLSILLFPGFNGINPLHICAENGYYGLAILIINKLIYSDLEYLIHDAETDDGKSASDLVKDPIMKPMFDNTEWNFDANVNTNIAMNWAKDNNIECYEYLKKYREENKFDDEICLLEYSF